MDFYYVTGSSRGIGRALVEELLKNTNNFVFGLSRNNFILYDRFEHIRIDLSNLEEVKDFRFQKHKRSDQVVLINNAATLGEVFPMGNKEDNEIIDTYNLNLLTPSLLMNKFINSYQSEFIKIKIMNISSGAGRHAVSSWSTYCASKSGLDMISEVIKAENINHSNFNIWSIAPGVVDTKMQDEIRKVDKQNFASVQKFIDYKTNNLLAKPVDVAKKLVSVLISPENYNQVCLDLRNFV